MKYRVNPTPTCTLRNRTRSSLFFGAFLSTNKCMALITKVVRISHSVIMMNYILALVNIIVNSPPQGLNFFCGKERIVRNGLSPVIYLFVNFVSLEQYISKRRNCNCVKGKVFARKFTDKCTWFNL